MRRGKCENGLRHVCKNNGKRFMKVVNQWVIGGRETGQKIWIPRPYIYLDYTNGLARGSVGITWKSGTFVLIYAYIYLYIYTLRYRKTYPVIRLRERNKVACERCGELSLA